MANDYMRVATFPTGDGISTTRVYWCRNTGMLRIEETSDGRYRAGGGPVVYKPALTPPATEGAAHD